MPHTLRRLITKSVSLSFVHRKTELQDVEPNLSVFWTKSLWLSSSALLFSRTTTPPLEIHILAQKNSRIKPESPGTPFSFR
jgi:hypothetical protein